MPGWSVNAVILGLERASTMWNKNTDANQATSFRNSI